jgi:hypothetical protein
MTEHYAAWCTFYDEHNYYHDFTELSALRTKLSLAPWLRLSSWNEEEEEDECDFGMRMRSSGWEFCSRPKRARGCDARPRAMWRNNGCSQNDGVGVRKLKMKMS